MQRWGPRQPPYQRHRWFREGRTVGWGRKALPSYHMDSTADEILCPEANTVLLTDEIDDYLARKVIYSLMYLNATLPMATPIYLVIASGGGDLFAGQAIADAVRIVAKNREVHGRVVGYAMSAAVFPLLSCTTRTASRHAFLMVHGLDSLNHGDIRSQEAEMALNKKLAIMHGEQLAERTGKPLSYWEPILADHMPHYYTATEALEEGLIDTVEG